MKHTKMLTLNTRNIKSFVSKKELNSISKKIVDVDKKIKEGTGEGNNFLGWLRLPSDTNKALISQIKSVAAMARKNSDILLCIGIGGSYLGSKAGIQFLSPLFPKPSGKKKLQILFCGNNLSPDYMRDLLDVITSDKKIFVNVISKSGTTIEPALSFRIIYDLMRKRYSKKEIKSRIAFTTDGEKGALKKMAIKEGFKTFVIPNNVGGRFSVMTPVGLFPMACAGIDIAAVIEGARDMQEYCFRCNPKSNIAYKYAVIRNVLYKAGKHIEILSGFHPSLHYILEWWKQLFGETEGKRGKGIFPDVADFTTDLHSVGQLIQEGKRNIFETFLCIGKPNRNIKIPRFKDNVDNLNYVAGEDFDHIERMAYKGTEQAHTSGNIPNMSIHVPERSAYYLGQIYYFFEVAVAASGYLLGINPFDQPGVEAYKNNMYRLLKRPKQ